MAGPGTGVAACAQPGERGSQLLREACLPQSCPLKVGPARFRAPELLFQPDLVGDESEGLHEVLAFAIHKSDMDLRRTLFANIVLSGGSTLFKGAVARELVVVRGGQLDPQRVHLRPEPFSVGFLVVLSEQVFFNRPRFKIKFCLLCE